MEKDLLGASAPAKQQKYYEKEMKCEFLFKESGPFWHLCTPGHLTEILLINYEDFEFGMNLTGICADKFPQLKIFTFELMDNHIHIILSGEKHLCEAMFVLFSSRLRRYLAKCGRKVDFSGFTPTLIQIPNLNALRNEIAYVNRNGFLVNSSHTPFSYPWGAGCEYFNRRIPDSFWTPFNTISIDNRRKICHSKDISLSDKLKVYNNIIQPLSFCYITEGEAFFRDAHHYFNLMSKNYEAYCEIAKRLSDSIFVSDEEMFSAVSAMCQKAFNTTKPSLLSPKAKIEMAKTMHSDYNATNKQIQRILRLDSEIVNTLFPSKG